jgi:hypothetical protein
VPTFESLPADVDLAFVVGDRVQFTCAFDADLTGYTFDVAIVDAITKAAVATATTSATTTGGETTVTVDFPDTVTDDLTASARYSWYFRWKPSGGGYRTVLSGVARVQQP